MSNIAKSDRMHGTGMERHRETLVARLGRWLSGDWWRLESLRGRYGVWHPWRRHIWENYRFTKAEARREQKRRNNGFDYGICEACGCTFVAHRSGTRGGIICPGEPNE